LEKKNSTQTFRYHNIILLIVILRIIIIYAKVIAYPCVSVCLGQRLDKRSHRCIAYRPAWAFRPDCNCSSFLVVKDLSQVCFDQCGGRRNYKNTAGHRLVHSLVHRPHNRVVVGPETHNESRRYNKHHLLLLMILLSLPQNNQKVKLILNWFSKILKVFEALQGIKSTILDWLF